MAAEVSSWRLMQPRGVTPSSPPFAPLQGVRECQEQLVLLDRTHGCRVGQIQKEYQVCTQGGSTAT
jgi:hypothetical protein